MTTVADSSPDGKSLDQLADELYGIQAQNDARQAFRSAVAHVASHAKARLPECTGRVDKAEALVLAGDVQVLADGTALVASQGQSSTQYHVNGACTCRDFPQAPHQFCKHRLARGIAIRAAALVAGASARPAADPPAQADMPIPAQFIVSLHGRQFVTYAGLLALAHQRGLVSLSASFISVTAELAIAQATAVFGDGKHFTEAADASPTNVGKSIAQHYARMALTRAKARCLRDALNIGMCAVEEVAE